SLEKQRLDLSRQRCHKGRLYRRRASLPSLSRYELERTAISLSRTGVFGNPYAIPTGPTAHVSPGYTILLAVIFDLFWESTTGEIIKELVSTTVTSFDFALLPFTADRL